MSADRDIVVMR